MVEEHSPHHSGAGSLDKTTAFIAFAVLAALLIAFAAYFLIQLGSLKSQVDASGAPVLADKVATLDRRVSALESSIAPSAIKLVMFYDSSDNFTSDDVNQVAAEQGSLAAQNLAVELVDMKGRISELKSYGFKFLPAVFLSRDEASRDARLLQSVSNNPPILINNVTGFSIEGLGFLYGRKLAIKSECTLGDGEVSLDEFTNFQCPSCAGAWSDLVYFTNATRGKVDFRLRHLPLLKQFPDSGHAAEAAECARDQHRFDDFVELAYKSNKNLSIAKLKEIGVTMHIADEAKYGQCIDSGDKALAVGRDVTEATLTYGLSTVPVFVANCRYEFVAYTAKQVASNLCAAIPGNCSAFEAGVPAATVPLVISGPALPSTTAG